MVSNKTNGKCAGVNGLLDKAQTGEYVLGKPPKKTGGVKLLFALVLYSLLTQVKGENLEDEEKKNGVL